VRLRGTCSLGSLKYACLRCFLTRIIIVIDFWNTPPLPKLVMHTHTHRNTRTRTCTTTHIGRVSETKQERNRINTQDHHIERPHYKDLSLGEILKNTQNFRATRELAPPSVRSNTVKTCIGPWPQPRIRLAREGEATRNLIFRSQACSLTDTVTFFILTCSSVGPILICGVSFLILIR